MGEISIPGVQEDKVDGDLASIPYPVATSAIYSSVALMSYLDGLLREEDFHEISTFGAVPVPADRFPMECSKMPIQATLKYLFRTKNLEIDSKEMMEEFKFHELHDQACRKALDTILKRVPTTCLGSLGWIFPACNNMMLTMPDSMARWESCGYSRVHSSGGGLTLNSCLMEGDRHLVVNLPWCPNLMIRVITKELSIHKGDLTVVLIASRATVEKAFKNLTGPMYGVVRKCLCLERTERINVRLGALMYIAGKHAPIQPVNWKVS